ncbi:MMPL family transporter [Cohnella cholangitidis]|uniref:MMPL family transporter n=1 Tax=Cohnella cholangitidis TaxID=2598458 RepID=A0A7G5BSB4_9BACL|nr:MMPL family transporter [Cohnella cholangitidis]QMV39848.1 MMPL family transporter [Cohnella cholangitidis]
MTIYRRMASFSIRNRSWVITFWVLLTLVSVPFAIRLSNVLGDHGLKTHGEYEQVQEVWSRELRMPDEPVIILFDNYNSRPKRVFHAFIAYKLNQLERVRGVSVAASPLERQEMEQGNYAYALVSVTGSALERKKAIGQIREKISEEREFKVAATGKPVIQEDVNRLSKQDLKTAERIGIPIAFVILAVALGGLLPAIIPIIAGAMSVFIAMGMMYAIGAYGHSSLSVFVYNVIPMVGMAVIDFALLMVSRFREERKGLSADEAILKTMATSGRAIVVSVGCVILALIGTFFIRMPIFNSVALGTLVVLLVSLMINLTFVPALLYRLRNPIFSTRAKDNRSGRNGLWMFFLTVVLRRPLASALLALFVLFISLYPVRAMEVGIPGSESLPKDKESRVAAERMAERFREYSVSQVLMIVKEERDVTGERNRNIVDPIRHHLARDPGVIGIDTVRSSVEEGVYYLTVWLRGKESSAESMQWVRDRSDLYSQFDVRIGGEPKYHQEVHDEVFNRMRYVLIFVLFSNFIVLSIAFRSLIIPLKAVAMNLASIGASFGILTWIFQQGSFGMEPTDIAIMIPVFIFGLTFGISMDYGVFLLSRIYERYRETADNVEAIREGLAASGKIITSAAAIMIAVTVPFAYADVTGVKQLGIGIAAALFLDATIMRMVLVPSLMKLFGKWNWWLPFGKN